MSAHLRFGKRRIAMPGSPVLRITIGILLVICGTLGFLPIVGFWMVPLGLLVLSMDIPAVRRFRRRVEIRYGRWRQRRRAEREAAGD